MSTSCMCRPLHFAEPYILSRCSHSRQKSTNRIFTYARNTTRLRWASTNTKSSQEPFYYPPPEQLTRPSYAHLHNRSIIRLHGQDVVHFLNGLLPAKLQPLQHKQSKPIYTAFLTAKGRVLYDVFLYPPLESRLNDPWYIDVDERSAASLLSHLKKHKLRSKFKLDKINPEELVVFYQWPSGGSNIPTPAIGGQDPRPVMGSRFLSSPGSSPTIDALRQEGKELSLTDYSLHRMIAGHAEGPTELIPNSALPQESNIDFTGGVDFHKGCYLGQELTIRTHHTGVVRKRILPCQIYGEEEKGEQDSSLTAQGVPSYDPAIEIAQPPSETNISKVRNAGRRAGRSTGKWLDGVGNIGLALCRLEMMTDIALTAEGSSHNPGDHFAIVWEDGEEDSNGRTAVRQVKVQPFVPAWLRQSIDAGLKARSERGQRRKQEQEEDEDDEDD